MQTIEFEASEILYRCLAKVLNFTLVSGSPSYSGTEKQLSWLKQEKAYVRENALWALVFRYRQDISEIPTEN